MNTNTNNNNNTVVNSTNQGYDIKIKNNGKKELNVMENKSKEGKLKKFQCVNTNEYCTISNGDLIKIIGKSNQTIVFEFLDLGANVILPDDNMVEKEYLYLQLLGEDGFGCCFKGISANENN